MEGTVKKLLLLLSLISFPSVALAADEKLGRVFADQPDVTNDYQIHFIYMLDKNGEDREWDINGEMEKELLEMNEKMFSLTGDKQTYKFDYREDGRLDISFVRLDRQGTHKGWNNNYPDYFIQRLGFNNPRKLYYVWADFEHRRDGGQMGVHSGYTFLLSKFNKTKDSRIQITLHELLHGQGFSWPCTAGEKDAHVKGQSLIGKPDPTYVLGNMIYEHSNEGCPDLKDSVYLTPTSDNPFDPLPMACHLAERAGRVHGESYGFADQWPPQYDHKKFQKIEERSRWCTYKLGEQNYNFKQWDE